MAQNSTLSPLAGNIEGDKYVSPTGAFRVRIPIFEELGGSISDTENVVTFQDEFNTHQSIACFKMDATQRWEEETRGRKEYLTWFFSNAVQDDFEKRFSGAHIESDEFVPSLQSGALFTYNLLPGGSMFAGKANIFDESAPQVAKRGNLTFVQNGFVFVLSIELAEKVIERRAFDKTTAEENEILRERLLTLLGKISFSAPPSTTAAVKKQP